MQTYHDLKQWLKDRKLWEPFTYLFFGGLTTVVNIAIYLLCRNVFGLYYQVANVISWAISVLFAYFTNKIWVFEARSANRREAWTAFAKFIFFRVLSLGLDMLCMFFMISLLSSGDLSAKIVTQIVVVLANYLFSKFWVFTGKKMDKK